MYAGLNILQIFFQETAPKIQYINEKWNAKKIDSNHPREDRKKTKRNKKWRNMEKTNNKMGTLKSNLSIIMLHVNDLKTPM